MRITTKELAEAIRYMRTDTELAVADVVRTIIETIRDGVVRGERVELRGLCSIETAERSERVVRNPKTGEPSILSARRVVRFKAGKALKDALVPRGA